MNIRVANSHDSNIITTLGRETYEQHFSDIWSQNGLNSFLSTNFNKEAIEESINNKKTTYVLQQNDKNEYVGIAKINWNINIPNTNLYGAELQKLYLLREYTGSGLGKQLITKCIDIAYQFNEHIIWLDVLKSNTGAKRFYEKNGFILCGEVDFKTDIKDIGLFVMQRFLSNQYND